jgi:glutamate synthase domain-containing protein 3
MLRVLIERHVELHGQRRGRRVIDNWNRHGRKLRQGHAHRLSKELRTHPPAEEHDESTPATEEVFDT